jgi:hypothetical protein
MMSPTCVASFRDGASYAKGDPSVVAAEPDVACIAGKLPAFKCTDDGNAVADLAARRVYQIRAPLHLPDQRGDAFWCVGQNPLRHGRQNPSTAALVRVTGATSQRKDSK